MTRSSRLFMVLASLAVAAAVAVLSLSMTIAAATTARLRTVLRGNDPPLLRVTRQGNEWFDPETAGWLEAELGDLCEGVAVQSPCRNTIIRMVNGKMFGAPLAFVGVSPNWFRLTGQQLAGGRFLTQDEVAEGQRVCVLGAAYASPEDFAPKLFQDRPSLRVGDVVDAPTDFPGEWEVIGVLRGTDAPITYPDGGWPQNDNMLIYVPLTALPDMPHLASDFALPVGVGLVIRNGGQGIEALTGKVRTLLASYDVPDRRLAIEVINPAAVVRDRLDRGVGGYFVGVALFLAIIAALQVANAAVQTISDQVRPLGIRRSLGATQWQTITRSFLWTISMTAGGLALGLAVAAFLAPVVGRLVDHETVLTSSVAARSGQIVLAFSLLGGIYPAFLAGNLDPVLAIGHGRKALTLNRRGDPRAFLAGAAVCLGVGAAVFLMAIGQGTQAQLDRYLEACGEGSLLIREADPFAAGGAVARVDEGLMTELTGRFAGQARFAYASSVPIEVRRAGGDKSVGGFACAVEGDFWAIRGLKSVGGGSSAGGFLPPGGGGVVIGADLAAQLFGDPAKALGGSVQVGDSGGLEVVGVLEPRGSGVMDPDTDRDYTVFLTAGQARAIPSFEALGPENRIWIAPLSEDAALAPTLQEILGQLYPAPGAPRLESILEGVGDLGTFRRVVGGSAFMLAVLGLIIGTFGLAQVMAIRFLERAREFAIRRTLGATKKAIALEMARDSVRICLVGGGAGLAAAICVALVVSLLRGWSFSVDVRFVLVGLGLSLVVGVLASLLPMIETRRFDSVASIREL